MLFHRNRVNEGKWKTGSICIHSSSKYIKRPTTIWLNESKRKRQGNKWWKCWRSIISNLSISTIFVCFIIHCGCRDRTEEAQLQIRAKEREVEIAQEQAELDIKHISQQMKHLQYENQIRIGEIRAENMTQLKLAQEDYGLQELELLNDKREIRRLLREKDETTELQTQQLKMKQSELLRYGNVWSVLSGRG